MLPIYNIIVKLIQQLKDKNILFY